MRSCPSAHGYTTKKSTAFSPTSSKYGSQSLLHDHMMAHYRRIHSAKAVIDNNAPKSRDMYIMNKLKSKVKTREKDSWMRSSWEMSTSLRTSSRMSNGIPVDGRPSSTPPYYREQMNGGFLPINTSQSPQTTHKETFDSTHVVAHGSEIRNVKSSTLETRTRMSNDENLNDLFTSNSLNGQTTERLHGTGKQFSAPETENYDMYPEFQVLKKKKERLDEEQKYLDFMNDITDEIIKRGIYSNRVLMHVCKGHVERRKHDLNEGQMWKMVNQMKSDLNISEDED